MKVFVSHSSNEAWVARQVATHLEQIGVEVFLDENDLETGDVFDEELRKQLATSDEVLMLLSQSAVKSSWVLMEIGAAWALDKRLVPIMVGIGVNELPGLVDKRHARDLNDIERYYDELKARATTSAATDNAPLVAPPAPQTAWTLELRIPDVTPIPGDLVRLPPVRPPNIRRPDAGVLIDFGDAMADYLAMETTVIAVDRKDGTARVAADNGSHWWAWEWMELLRPHDLTSADVPPGTRLVHPVHGPGEVLALDTTWKPGLTVLDVQFDNGSRDRGIYLETTPFTLEE